MYCPSSLAILIAASAVACAQPRVGPGAPLDTDGEPPMQCRFEPSDVTLDFGDVIIGDTLEKSIECRTFEDPHSNNPCDVTVLFPQRRPVPFVVLTQHVVLERNGNGTARIAFAPSDTGRVKDTLIGQVTIGMVMYITLIGHGVERPADVRDQGAVSFALTWTPEPGAIRFDIRAAAGGTATIDVAAPDGRMIASLRADVGDNGVAHVRWPSEGAASGIYFYRARLRERLVTGRCVLMR